MENYDEFKNSSLFFQRIVKQQKKSSENDMPRNKLHSGEFEVLCLCLKPKRKECALVESKTVKI